jgi:hypothetical protein
MDPYTLVAMASAEDDDRRSAPRLALLTVGCQATSDGIPRRSAIASGTAQRARCRKSGRREAGEPGRLSDRVKEVSVCQSSAARVTDR